MNPFAFLHKKLSAKQLLRQGRRAELQELISAYPPRSLALPKQGLGYPCVLSLEVEGLGAYLLDVHLDTEHLTNIEQLIEKLGFNRQQPTAKFHTFSRQCPGPEAVSIQTQRLGLGTALLLISNSIELLQKLPELAPPKPWEVFPEVDADGLGSLQGSLEHWWNNYWWPYWLNLTPQQRASLLDDGRHPEGWREYIRLQDELNGTNREPQA